MKLKDGRGVNCSVKKSSENGFIWLGANEIGLIEFIAGRQPSAWEEIELEDTQDHCFIANNRMKISRKIAKKLIPILQKFADTCDI